MALINKTFTKKYYINEEGVRRVIETKTTKVLGITIVKETKDKRARIQPVPETQVTAEEATSIKEECGCGCTDEPTDEYPEGDTEPR